MDLVEVEVLEADAGLGEHARHRVGGRHEQALVAADVVDRCGLGVGEVREHRQAVLRAHSSLASSTVEAPSESGVELPAVIVPSSPPKTGLSFASFSTVESGRRFWSRSRPRKG